MVTIKLRTSNGGVITLTGSENNPIKITARGSSTRSLNLSTGGTSSSAVLSTAAMPQDDWYELWKADKKRAMLNGGVDPQGRYNFSAGLLKLFIKNSEGIPYIKRISGAQPLSDGKLFILGDKYISIFPEDGVLRLGAITLSNQLCEWLTEIYYFTWRLYHAYNHLMARLVYMDKNTEHQLASRVNLGPRLATLMEYQAQVAVYNHTVWKSAYQLNVDTVVEKVAVGIGYTAQDCETRGVLMTITIKPKEVSEAANDALNSLTIFRSGKSTHAGGNSVNTADLEPVAVVMQKIRGAQSQQVKTIYGTGYESEYHSTGGYNQTITPLGPWHTIRIAILTPPLTRRQRYYEVFSLAIGTGMAKTLELPENPNNAVRLEMDITTTWTPLDDVADVANLKAQIGAGDFTSINDRVGKHRATVSRSNIKANPIAVNVAAEEEE